MKALMDRRAQFLALLPPAADAAAFAARADLAAELEHFVAAERAAWPSLQADEARLIAFFSARVSAADLPSAPAGDTLLACACLDGDALALRVFEERFFAPLASALNRRYPSDIVAETLQRLRIQLFVEGGIDRYGARGALAGWLRVIAVREAHRVRADGSGVDLPADDAVASALATPERAVVAASTQRALEAALRAAILELEPRQRALLRFYYVDRLGIDRMAPLYGVHRATCARWLEQARADLVRRARHAVQREFSVADASLPSVFRALDSQLHVSLRKIFSDLG
jgi:RNA polymerase sigma-70 factor (ECF subfamily)